MTTKNIAGLLCWAVAASYAQSPGQSPSLEGPTFEVASVKPAPPDARGYRCTGGPGTSDPGSLTCENYSLSFLVMMAYDLRSFQLTAPAWMDTARYNVVAKIPPGADGRQFGLMQQRLLAERFGLEVHFRKERHDGVRADGGQGRPETHGVERACSRKDRGGMEAARGGPPVRAMARVDRKGDSVGDLASFLRTSWVSRLRMPPGSMADTTMRSPF